MVDCSEKRNRQLAFELQYLRVCEERSNQSKSIVKPFLSTTGLSKTSLAPGLVEKLTKISIFSSDRSVTQEGSVYF